MSEINKWTVMFYFAGDNELAPIIVSQLKSIKDAGFQENTDVLVHFDPNEHGAPTRIYHVNRERKEKREKERVRNPRLSASSIGDAPDSSVYGMAEDDIHKRLAKVKGRVSKKMKEALRAPDKIDATTALQNFLGYCRENHQAENYILFLVGHGSVVGHDSFLPDDNPKSGISLCDLGRILRGFSAEVAKKEGVFQLLAMHSCSMSGLEVAYQLKGTAKYMIASQGPSFVGAWPYRQMLMEAFSTIDQAGRHPQQSGASAPEATAEVQRLVEKLYDLTYDNAKDFMLAGYSLDMALCSLDEKKFEELKKQITGLVSELKAALTTERGKELILLAHWESQSFWGENYTDIYDFCHCLSKRCAKAEELKALVKACDALKIKLDPAASEDVSERFERIVIRSANFGSKHQYSHGLSVYFPWSRPIEVSDGPGKGIMKRYEKDYAFTTEMGADSWFSFLNSYFTKTQREQTRLEEDGETKQGINSIKSARPYYNRPDQSRNLWSIWLSNKPVPQMGVSCACPSIKNFPEEDAKVKGKKICNVPFFSMTQDTSDLPN